MNKTFSLAYIQVTSYPPKLMYDLPNRKANKQGLGSKESGVILAYMWFYDQLNFLYKKSEC